MSIADQNILQPKASSEQSVHQHQKATLQVAPRFIEAIVLTKTPWPLLFDVKYSIVEEAGKLEIEAEDSQRSLAGAPVGTPFGCQLPGVPSVKIDLHTRETVSLEFCLMLLN